MNKIFNRFNSNLRLINFFIFYKVKFALRIVGLKKKKCNKKF